MLTQIDVVYENESGTQALAMPLAALTPKDSLLLRSVSGLNPPDVDLFIGDYSRDGGIYQGRSVQKRNVVMLMDLNPNPALGETFDGLRDILYKTFIDPLVDADYLQIVLHDDVKEDRYLVGYTEKLETELFSQDTMVQVSMICPDPFIRSMEQTLLTHETGWTTVPFTYTGTAETGFEVEIQVVSDTAGINLVNNGKKMTIDAALVVDDVVYVNTNRGYRQIRKTTLTNLDAMKTAHEDWTTKQIWDQLIEDESTTSLMAKLTAQSRWLELHSQNNSMRIYGTTEGSLPAVIKLLTYSDSFWGA